MNKKILKIVITGGPCGGKSTAMSRMQSHFTELGYRILFVSETATELIKGGVSPWTCGTNKDYQLCQIQLQRAKERVFEQAAASMPEEKILIVCDRGAIDSKAYMEAEDFYSVLKTIGTTEIELRDSYDAVFHLVTAAKGAKQFYTTANNSARTETPEQAARIDDKIIAAWTGHPHMRVIDNAGDFDIKMKKLLHEISVFLGEPEPYEVERKFLIEYPDIALLQSLENCQRVEIIQTYLTSKDGEEVRVRQRGCDGSYIYFKTIKRRISGLKCVEIEDRLSKDEYLALLMSADTSKRQIRKDRYCLTYRNQYFEIDVYPFWTDKAIAEIELSNETDPIFFPDYIKVIKEVTEDLSYKNSALAKEKV
ncbi:MAG: AAA family ATPase [Clostridia bacterium]|nr:AAA family ATPase [Clostridia bacterium]